MESATRLHEAGIASNRGSARRGEYVLKSCTRVAMRSSTLVGALALIFGIKKQRDFHRAVMSPRGKLVEVSLVFLDPDDVTNHQKGWTKENRHSDEAYQQNFAYLN